MVALDTQRPRRRKQLERVYWLGVVSGAGKSTIAAHFARTFGMGVYSTDEAMTDQAGPPGSQVPYERDRQRHCLTGTRSQCILV